MNRECGIKETHICDFMCSRSDQDSHPLLLRAKRPLLRSNKLVTQAKQVQLVSQSQHGSLCWMSNDMISPQLSIVTHTPHLHNHGNTHAFQLAVFYVIVASIICDVLPTSIYMYSRRGLAMAETCPAHWVIVLHLGLEGCSQPRELWFVDILMYVWDNIP